MKFSEAVSKYSEWKRANKGTSVVTGKELAKIRKSYNEGLMTAPKSDSAYVKALSDYREWKQANKGTRGVSMREKQILKNKVAAGTSRVNESVEAKNARLLESYRQWKQENKGTRGVSMKERQILFQTGSNAKPIELKDNSVTHYFGQTAGLKESITSKVREAHKCVYLAKRAMRENDMMAAADQTQAAGDAINSADAAVGAAPAGAVPQDVVATVQNIKTDVDNLATQCGIESPVDLNGDAGAGVPAAQGVPTDPNAAPAPAAPMTESKSRDLNSVRARLAAREAKVRAIQEGTEAIEPDGTMITAELNATSNPQSFAPVKKDDAAEQVVPTTKKSSTAANTWPTEKISVKESMSEKMVSDKLNESQDNWSFSKILESGVLG